MRARRPIFACLLVVALGAGALAAGAPAVTTVSTDDVRQWLTFLASDDLRGRGDYTPELERAAGYIADHLSQWGVKPAGDAGSYLQTVQVQGIRTTSRSFVTVQVGNSVRTFHDGDGVRFSPNAGANQLLALDHVEFVGYGLEIPAMHHQDLHGRDLKGAVAIWLGPRGPKDVNPDLYRTLLGDRSRRAIEEGHAAAGIGEQYSGERSGRRGGGQVDFTTSERLDKVLAPRVTANDAFFNFVFSQAPVAYQDLKRLADRQEPLPSFPLKNVKITFTIDARYDVVRTDTLHNVVGTVEGTDPRLKSTYLIMGAHYDHLGSAANDDLSFDGRRRGLPGKVSPGAEDDRIWNGADDDGSGTVAVMALAKAFANGPRPRRSLLFIWHAGEEIGLYGSAFFADHPTVPIESMVAELNIDMVGRNRGDSPSEANTVYLVGSDRISSELHELSRRANADLAQPMTFNYELNDPSDPEEFYYRSDHHSYAAKGIPVIFFTTGLHPDYHANTDEVSKIVFDKLAHVTDLVYETATRVANLEHAPARDNKGARAGKDTK